MLARELSSCEGSLLSFKRFQNEILNVTLLLRQACPSEARPPGASTNRSFYSDVVAEFMSTDPDAIVGRLSSQQTASHFSIEIDQLRAWKREIEILRCAFAEAGPMAQTWSVLLETPLLRLGKRWTLSSSPRESLQSLNSKSAAARMKPAIASKSRSGNQPAALLSGNRPLVHVLTEALASDYAYRSGGSKKQAKSG